MAYRRVSLPVIKLTRRPAVGEKSMEFIHADIPTEPTCVPSETVDKGNEEQGVTQDPSELDPFLPCSTSDDTSEPKLHELESRASAAGWDKIRKEIIDVLTENAAIPVGQVCLNCEKLASLRCQECGPLGFFCSECFDNAHRSINLFHVAEKWEGDHYVPVTNERHIDVRPSHVCDSKKEMVLHCLDEHGVEHRIQFSYCHCEPLMKTLCRAQLWPATPTYPHYAFSFALLDWAEALLLECQVALKDFCNALSFRAPFYNQKRRDVYSCMINAFEEFRFIKHNLRHLSYISSHLDSGNVCPACPQNGGKVIYAMDALFGLPRKKSAGVSYKAPLLGNLFFGDQSSVDQFVAENKTKKNTKSFSTTCNDFLAGNMLRSASRYNALDETAVFGCSCRHEFPVYFINLKHGERLAYAVWMLETMLSRHMSSGSDLYFMYDIACTLYRHLQSIGRADLLSSCHLCLPTFHSYGHNASCQVLFGPRRCDGVGLSDGEMMERLWSYMRRYSRMTKEMRPSHRIDVLCSALVYYGLQKKRKFTSLILVRLERALNAKAVAEEVLEELMPALLQEKEKEHEIQDWLVEESVSCNSDPALLPNPSKWQVEYFKTLQVYYSLRSCEVDEVKHGSLVSLERKLDEIEKAYSLSHRWLPTDHEYTENQQAMMRHKKEQVLLALWRSSQRRLFLLKLKGKYAEGQKIAKKLSSQINKESITLQSLLEEYNACGASNDSSSGHLCLPDVFNPSVLEAKLQSSGTWCSLAAGEKREIIDSYLVLCRCREEITMLQEDANNIIAYYTRRKKVIQEEIKSHSCQQSLYNMGATSLLHSALIETSRLLRESIHTADLVQKNISGLSLDCASMQSSSSSDSCSSSDEL